MAQGAFQVSRELFENPIWQDVIKFRIFFYIVGNAVHRDEGVKLSGVHVKRGQFLRSYRNLASDLEYIENRSVKSYSTSVIKKKIEQLVKEERLMIEDTELGTLFTVVNYALYQGFQRYKKESENSERTAREQIENGVRTDREQRENNNKNVNNDKNVKNDSKNISGGGIGEIDPLFGQAYEMLQKNFIHLNSIQQEEIAHHLDNGIELEVLQEAVNKTKLNGKDIGYFFGILRRCETRGIKTLDQYREQEAQHQRSKESRDGRSRRGGYQKQEKPAIEPVRNENVSTDVTDDDVQKALEMARKLDRERKP